jgi:hypothetical protein
MVRLNTCRADDELQLKDQLPTSLGMERQNVSHFLFTAIFALTRHVLLNIASSCLFEALKRDVAQNVINYYINIELVACALIAFYALTQVQLIWYTIILFLLIEIECN